MDMTFVDRLIVDGQSELMNLPRFYDSVLMTNRDRSEHIIRIPTYDIFLRYREHFQEAVILYQLPRSMIYKPKLVSSELYGTTEMWLSLLRLNAMRNVAEFNRPMIMVYDPSIIRELIELFFKREGKIT